MKYKKFKHSAINQFFPQIEPIKNVVPSFYKKENQYLTKEKITALPTMPTFKKCSVYGDSFLVGYSLPLVVDIAVKQTEDGPIITWNQSEIQVVKLRHPLLQNSGLPIPMGCSPQEFLWSTQHAYEIPKGYSALLTHPLNRHDLPFYTLSGVVDDYVVQHNGNIPVFFSSTFEGIISQGTPIAQILLFKRENWKLKLDKSVITRADKNIFLSSSKAGGWYKNNIWKKKYYE